MNKLIGSLSIIAFIVVVLCVITWNNNMQRVMQNNRNATDSYNQKNNINITNMIEEDNKTAAAKMSDETNMTDEDILTDDTNKTDETNMADNAPSTILQPKEGQPIKEINLVAIENIIEIKQGINLLVWTYGGTVPGTEIRVTQGDFVRVHLTNTLQEPITIHWHGYPVKSEMDGIPGYTQDAVLPGETFTYEFSADYVGTYWYHSHQESSKQVDMGLYGALIVEPKIKTIIDKEYTLILDEWMENNEEDMTMSMPSDSSDDTLNMDNASNASGSMSSVDGNGPEMAEEKMMKELYNIYTVNGKSGAHIRPLEVNIGDVIKLRFINAGYRSHGIHIPGQVIKVVSSDGQEIMGADEIKDQIIVIAPGERYDVEFIVQSEDSFIIDFHDENLFNDQLKIPVVVNGGNGNILSEDKSKVLLKFDLSIYGSFSEGQFTLDQEYDVEQYIELNSKVDNDALRYTINGSTFDELLPITIKTGDFIKLTYENKSSVDHPMHLHGHFFQILSKNDIPFSDTTIRKDTLLIKSGEKYVIAFKADNPGNWVQHCHELHHAAAGMMQKIIYSDYKANYTPDPNNMVNKPE
ncbi:MAG: hypothetical protein K0S01_564 [Herbinix sp.]|jgi:FtsP/CotA-like multicopper oxidase with cupredoxin domain|nr:hypothetical protein [Herbinix sp.]